MKIVFIVIALSFIVSLSSCTKKKYTCDCTWTNGYIKAETEEKISKKEAEDWCDDLEDQFGSTGFCVLKEH